MVFFAIGFETTTPPTALAIRAAAKKGLANFTVFCNHVLTPSAMRAILESGRARRAADRSTALSARRMFQHRDRHRSPIESSPSDYGSPW